MTVNAVLATLLLCLALLVLLIGVGARETHPIWGVIMTQRRRFGNVWLSQAICLCTSFLDQGNSVAAVAICLFGLLARPWIRHRPSEFARKRFWRKHYARTKDVRKGMHHTWYVVTPYRHASDGVLRRATTLVYAG